MLFRRRPQPFMYHVAPKTARMVVSHNEPFEETIEMRRNVAAHPVLEGNKMSLRKAHRDNPFWEEGKGSGNCWKEHRSTQYR